MLFSRARLVFFALALATCGDSALVIPCKPMTGMGPLVSGAMAFRVDVYGAGVPCVGNWVGPGAPAPLLSKSFAKGDKVTLDVPPGQHTLVLATFSDPAATQQLGSACLQTDLKPGERFCDSITLTPSPDLGVPDAGPDMACTGMFCTPCTTPPDSCGAALFCDPVTLLCEPGCKNTSDCAAAADGGATVTPFCNTKRHVCVECLKASDCPGSRPCTPIGTCGGGQCTSDGDCSAFVTCGPSGCWCNSGGSCVPKSPLGASCTAGGHCLSGSCVDTVCCDTVPGACGGCRACNLSGNVGRCMNVPATQDPHGACIAGLCTLAACAGDGTCNVPDNTRCGAPTCGASVETDQVCQSGSCTSSTKSCAPFACSGNICAGTCGADTDCAGNAYCAGNSTCQPQKTQGVACNLVTDCLVSGCRVCATAGCVDGVCCNQATCTGCNACDLAGTTGACTPVPSGQDPKSACTGTCATGCNGSGSCAYHAPGSACATSCTNTGCVAGRCSAGSLLTATCSGSSATCPAPSSAPCPNQLVCASATACHTSCAVDADCVTGFRCTAPNCIPGNDCPNAAPIDMTRFSQTISSSTVGATHTLNAPCSAGGGGPEAFYTFTLTKPELVYADTVGASWDTVLFFASNCTTPLLVSAPATGLIECDDDLAPGAGCTGGGVQSQVTAYLLPGTYYLVLSGKGTASGTAFIHFEHQPTGNNGATAAPYPAPTLLPAGSSTQTGTTAGTGIITARDQGLTTCYSNGGFTTATYGNGPEQTYFWRSCPENPGGSFTATTCGTAFDTLIYVSSPGSGGDCDDDNSACTATNLTSILPHPTLASVSIPAGAGLHVFTVDAYGPTDSGAFSATISRP